MSLHYSPIELTHKVMLKYPEEYSLKQGWLCLKWQQTVEIETGCVSVYLVREFGLKATAAYKHLLLPASLMKLFSKIHLYLICKVNTIDLFMYLHILLLTLFDCLLYSSMLVICVFVLVLLLTLFKKLFFFLLIQKKKKLIWPMTQNL